MVNMYNTLGTVHIGYICFFTTSLAADDNNCFGSSYTMYTLIFISQSIIKLLSFLAEQCSIVWLTYVAGSLSCDGKTAETKPWDSKGDGEKENGVVSCAEALQVVTEEKDCVTSIKGLEQVTSIPSSLFLEGKKGTGISFPKKTTSFTSYSLIKTVYQCLVIIYLCLLVLIIFIHLRPVPERKWNS